MAIKEIDKTTIRPARDFFAEAQVMFASAHANIVQIQYACETPTHVCLAMPFYQKGTLMDRIERAPLTPRETIRVGIAVCDGLTKIHSSGFVHLDVKPSNVMFSDLNVPMVADFGQSMSLTPTGLAAVPPMYTFCFAPEIFSSAVTSPLVDVYQAGLLLYRAINGDRFFKDQLPATRAAIETGKFPNRNVFMPHVPKRLRTIIRKAMKVDPAQRYQSAFELSRDLGRVSVPLDWATTILVDGTTTWTAVRPGQPDLIIEKLFDSRRLTWKVSMFTQRSGVRRARNAAAHKDALANDQADLYVKQLFETVA